METQFFRFQMLHTHAQLPCGKACYLPKNQVNIQLMLLWRFENNKEAILYVCSIEADYYAKYRTQVLNALAASIIFLIFHFFTQSLNRFYV